MYICMCVCVCVYTFCPFQISWGNYKWDIYERIGTLPKAKSEQNNVRADLSVVLQMDELAMCFEKRTAVWNLGHPYLLRHEDSERHYSIIIMRTSVYWELALCQILF